MTLTLSPTNETQTGTYPIRITFIDDVTYAAREVELEIVIFDGTEKDSEEVESDTEEQEPVADIEDSNEGPQIDQN